MNFIKVLMKDRTIRRERLYILSGGICSVCKKPLGTDYQRHHSEHDTKGNNQNYPLYTQSLIGFKALHGKCHENNPSEGKIPEIQVQYWENFLQSWVAVIKSGAVIPFGLVMEEMKILVKENK